MKRDALKDVAELKRAILEAIDAHDSQWYWYQLDRELIAPNPHLSSQLMTAIQELESEELVRITPNPERADLQAYCITDAGNRALGSG